MRNKPVSALLLLTVALICVPPAFPKGPVDKIVIKGGGLAQAIEVKDRATLKSFDPWGGQFIDWSKGPVAAPRDIATSYEVYFYMFWLPTDREMTLKYVIRYVPGSGDAPGYVYLPGRGEKWYSTNMGTIMRGDNDGRWHLATGAWSVLVQRLVTARGTSSDS